MLKQPIHFSGLNGLRSLSVIFVIFAHTTYELTNFGLDRYVFGKDSVGHQFGGFLAGIGVAIFFAISGFLITYLLLEEKAVSGINVKNFYVRRILRIWPLYYLYLVIVITSIYFLESYYPQQNLLFYIFLCANIPFVFGGVINLLGHYWSLGVEEQFYILWPWVIRKVKTEKILRIMFVVLLLMILVKVALRLLNIYWGYDKPFYFVYVNRYDCLVIGALAGVLLHQKKQKVLNAMSSIYAQLAGWGILTFFICNFSAGLLFSHELAAIGSVLIIISNIRSQKLLINLENPFFDFIGKISYGMYVYHPVVYYTYEHIIHFKDRSHVNYLIVYFLVFGTTVLISYFSYLFFELKFLKLKTRFTRILSSGTRELEEQINVHEARKI